MKNFRSILSASLIALVLAAAPAHATNTSTINPNNPAQGSALSSATLRANFLAAYNDINTIYGQIATTVTSSITSLTGDVTTGTPASGVATATVGRVNGVSYPATPSTNTVPVVTNTGVVTYEAVPNSALVNSSVTVAGYSIALGGTQTLAASDLTNGVSGTGAIVLATGNAATATALKNAQTINGVSFNGTAGITVTAAAGTLTGSALASGVTSSSLTSFGTLTAPLNIGTPGFSDTGVAIQLTGSTNSYFQQILQNTNTGSSASADYIFGGNDMTASTHYGNLGSNGSAGGTAPFTNADARYVYTSDNEFDIGALGTSGAINLAVGATPTRELSVGTSSIVASELISAPHFSATDTTANVIPVGTIGQRPTASEGQIRDNTTIHQIEAYLNGSWQQLGLSSVRVISSGSSDTANAYDNTIVWNSGTASAKTESIPAASASNAGKIMQIKDEYGELNGFGGATNYNITITPASGTIGGLSAYPLTNSGANITIQSDGISNWMVM